MGFATVRARGAVIKCTSCFYCFDDCPVHIDIPGIFSMYNKFVRNGEKSGAREMYSQIRSDRRGDACISCGACQSSCPFSIDIPKELAMVHKKLYTEETAGSEMI